MFEEHELLIWDWERGEIINPATGEVVDRIYVNQVPMVENDRGELVPRLSVVTPRDALHPLHLPHNTYTLLLDALDVYRVIKTRVLKDVPCSYYRIEDTLRGYLKKLGAMKVRNLRRIEYLVALVYVALEENMIAVDVVALSKLLSIPRHRIQSAIIKVKEALNKKTPFEFKTKMNIRTYGAILGLGEDVIALAVKLYEEHKEKVKNCAPKTVSLVFLYVALKRMSIDAEKVLCKVVRVDKISKIARRIIDAEQPPARPSS